MSELFLDIVRQVEESGQIQEILKNQQVKYQLQPFKMQGIDCQAIKKTYRSIQEKYQTPAEAPFDPNNWNENQRRVFIWFIIFYTHFHQISANEITPEQWQTFSPAFFNKNPQFLHFQLLSMMKPHAKVAWTREEDDRLIEAVQDEEYLRWNDIAKALFYNSNCTIFKSPKHCRERWLNHLDDKKKRGLWTPQEDLKIFRFVLEYGKRWCKLVPVLKETRTEHMIKNRYNSLVNKQRKSKKEREEQLCLRILKQLKKQIQNVEARKRLEIIPKMEEQEVEPEVQVEPEEVDEPKLENVTPEEKINSENLNTNEKQEQVVQKIQAVEEPSEMNEDANEYPFACITPQPYYQIVPPHAPYYGYSYVPETVPYLYPAVPAPASIYWM